MNSKNTIISQRLTKIAKNLRKIIISTKKVEGMNMVFSYYYSRVCWYYEKVCFFMKVCC